MGSCPAPAARGRGAGSRSPAPRVLRGLQPAAEKGLPPRWGGQPGSGCRGRLRPEAGGDESLREFLYAVLPRGKAQIPSPSCMMTVSDDAERARLASGGTTAFTARRCPSYPSPSDEPAWSRGGGAKCRSREGSLQFLSCAAIAGAHYRTGPRPRAAVPSLPGGGGQQRRLAPQPSRPAPEPPGRNGAGRERAGRGRPPSPAPPGPGGQDGALPPPRARPVPPVPRGSLPPAAGGACRPVSFWQAAPPLRARPARTKPLCINEC